MLNKKMKMKNKIRIVLLLLILLFVECTKSFVVPTLRDIDDYKMIYKISDKDIIDTLKIPNGYEIRHR
jgi:hypothetical protein